MRIDVKQMNESLIARPVRYELRLERSGGLQRAVRVCGAHEHGVHVAFAWTQ